MEGRGLGVESADRGHSCLMNVTLGLSLVDSLPSSPRGLVVSCDDPSQREVMSLLVHTQLRPDDSQTVFLNPSLGVTSVS